MSEIVLRMGGYFFDENGLRTQLPLICNPSFSELVCQLNMVRWYEGVIGIDIRPEPKLGVFDLTMHYSCGKYLVMLSEYTATGDVNVRTPHNDQANDMAVIFLGDSYSSKLVIDDFDAVIKIFAEFIDKKNVSNALLS